MTLTRDEKEFDYKLLAVIGEGGTEDLFKLKNLLEAIDHNITRSVPDNMLKIFQTRPYQLQQIACQLNYIEE